MGVRIRAGPSAKVRGRHDTAPGMALSKCLSDDAAPGWNDDTTHSLTGSAGLVFVLQPPGGCMNASKQPPPSASSEPSDTEPIHPSICPTSIKHLLCANTLIGTEDTAENKTNTICSCGADFQVGRQAMPTRVETLWREMNQGREGGEL